jgi:hypothetical protein
MTISGRNVLVVGQGFLNAEAWTDLLTKWRFRCHFAGNLRSARELLDSVRIDLVLSNINLPDGTGFALLAELPGFPVSAFLCLPVENSCFWLPAIDDGSVCLGLPALRPAEFAQELQRMAARLPSDPRVITASAGIAAA